MRWLLVVMVGACGGDDPAPVCGDGFHDDFEQCDDGNTRGGDGCAAVCELETRVTTRWEIYPALGGPALARGCRGDVATVEVVTSEGNAVEVPCDDRRMADIWVGIGHRVLVRLRAPDRAIVSESLPRGGGLGPVDWSFAFYADAGYVRFAMPRPAACNYGEMVQLSLVPVAGGPVTTHALPCISAGARDALSTSPPIAAGTYDVTVDDTEGRSHHAFGVTVKPENRVTDLTFE